MRYVIRVRDFGRIREEELEEGRTIFLSTKETSVAWISYSKEEAYVTLREHPKEIYKTVDGDLIITPRYL